MYFCTVKRKKDINMKHTETPMRTFDLMDNKRHLGLYLNYIDGQSHDMTVSVAEMRHTALGISYAMLRRGIGRSERVAIVSKGRTECAAITLGLMQIGATPILLDKNLTAEQYIALLGEVRMLIVEDERVYQRFRLILPQLASLRWIASIETVSEVTTIAELVDDGHRHTDNVSLTRRMSLATTDDVCLCTWTGGLRCNPISHKALIQCLFNNE